MTSDKSARPRKNIHAFWLFFPAAAILAAIAVPLSIYGVLSDTGWPPGLLAAGHGHELVFGFALALIAGYTLGPQPRRILAPLFILWLLARITWLLAPDSWPAQLLSPAFALLLARYVVPRFNAAKKWRNKIAGPLILVLCLMVPGFWLTGLVGLENLIPGRTRLLQSAVLGLLLLMTFMGGRIIAPAVAGTLEKKGFSLEARVQPRIEGALIVLLIVAMGLTMSSATDRLAGAVLLCAALLITVRILRWRLWLCPERPDLLVFAAGYLWLAAGAVVAGTHLLAGITVTPALHLITVGALGTLSASVMLRLAWQRASRCPPPGWQPVSLAAMLGLSAIFRYLAGPTPFSSPGWLWLSAGLWCVAYLGVGTQLLILYRLAHNRRK
ncbi:MAG: NnrS family protein [Marinobacter sp.]|uniref:NnrS family protein n=1 Tax=Marinobacter sp. TaxID=50741 RepID=UPI00396DB241